jgi:hypothetical protein
VLLAEVAGMIEDADRERHLRCCRLNWISVQW